MTIGVVKEIKTMSSAWTDPGRSQRLCTGWAPLYWWRRAPDWVPVSPMRSMCRPAPLWRTPQRPSGTSPA